MFTWCISLDVFGLRTNYGTLAVNMHLTHFKDLSLQHAIPALTHRVAVKSHFAATVCQ